MNLTPATTVRSILATELHNCDRDAEPGSRAAYRCANALAALSRFDSTHPEVIVHLRRPGIAAAAAREARGMGLTGNAAARYADKSVAIWAARELSNS